MLHALSALALILSLVDAAPMPPTMHTTALDRRRHLLATSTARCELGSDGVMVELDMGSSAASLRSKGCSPIKHLLDKIAGSPGSHEVMHTLHSIDTVAARLSTAGVDALLKDPEIKSITANCILQVDPIEDQGALERGVGKALSWGLDRIDSRSGTDGNYDDSGATGSGALVYVLDTGVRISHNDFGGRALPGWSAECPTGNEGGCGNDATGWLYQGVITPDKSRCHGHGTHCASTVGGADYGVAEGVTIITVQVLSCQGSGSSAGVSAGVEWAVDDAKKRGKPAVLSMSLGGGGSNAFDRVINAAYAEGVLTVVAAGNSNDNACRYSPASTALAVTVGSTDSSDRKSSFSNHGTCVDIHAPGSSITAAWATSDTATTTISGTSMACPHVAGVAAQLRAIHRDMTPKDVTEALLCLSTKGAINNLPSNTANALLFNDLDGTDASTCFSPAPPASPSPPPSKPSPPPPSPSPIDGELPPSADFVGLFQPPAAADGKMTWTAAVRGRYENNFPTAEVALRRLHEMIGGEPPKRKGVQVLDGGAGKSPQTTCIDPESDVTAIEGKNIAAQCCEKGVACRRWVDQHNDEGCIAGHAGTKPPMPMPYMEAKAKCESLGLDLCERNCKNAGCFYNFFPVYTSLTCELDDN